MIAVVSVGVGLLWLLAAVFLLVLVTVVIRTGDPIDELDRAPAEGESARAEQPVGEVARRLTTSH